MDRDLRLLGLKRGFKPDDLKASWRRLAKERHPDASPSDPDAHEKFLALTEAYARLCSASSETHERVFMDPEAAKKAETAFRKAGTAFREFSKVNAGNAEDLLKLREAALSGGSLVDADRYMRFLDIMYRSGQQAKTLYAESLAVPGGWKEEAEANIAFLEARLARCQALMGELGKA